MTSITGSGGNHWLFKPDPRVRNSVGTMGDGLDTRAHGGYVVAPPSIHPNGQPYTWAPGLAPGEVGIAAAPEWLIEMACQRKAPARAVALPAMDGPRPEPQPLKLIVPGTERAYAESALVGEAEALLETPEGSRNHRLNKAAFRLGQLVAAGWLDATEVAETLAAVAVAIGLESDEIERTLASGLGAGMATPRAVA